MACAASTTSIPQLVTTSLNYGPPHLSRLLAQLRFHQQACLDISGRRAGGCHGIVPAERALPILITVCTAAWG